MNEIFNIVSPTGEKYPNVINFKEFCTKHGLNYKNAIEQIRHGKSKTYKGYQIDIVGTSSEYDKMESYGLTLEERLAKVIEDNKKLQSELKVNQRQESLFKVLSGFVNDVVVKTEVVPFKETNKKAEITESAVLLLSDLHADQEILSNRVQDLEYYNFDVATRRAERIVEVIISHLIENMKNYKFERLYIFGLGDYVCGEIHNATEHTKWKNAIKNAMATGELIANMINELSKYFPEIVFISVSGNHGRRSNKKDYRGAHNNWDYLVASYAVSKLQPLIDSGRLKYEIPDSWSAGVEIYGWNFVLNHGDDIRGWNGIPFYGIERKTRRLTSIGAVTGKIPNYFMFGHFHNEAHQQHTTGEVFINGSFPATDEFALEGLGAYSEPHQLIFGVHPKYGITWRMPIKLRTHNWKIDERKKGRYNIKIIGD